MPAAIINKGKYTVQAGVFSSRTRATQLVGSLRSKGMEAVILRRTFNGKTAFIIQAGSFSTKSGAEHRALELKRKGFSTLVKP